MSEFLFVGGPLHGQIHDYTTNISIEPEGSSIFVVSIDEETYRYERTSYFPRWQGPEYLVATFSGSNYLIQETIERTSFRPLPR